MGIRAWRRRQLDRADALIARGNEGLAELRAEEVERRESAARVQDDAVLSWRESRAVAVGVDHDEMVKRAERFGLPLPEPHRADVFERFAGWNAKAAGVLPGGTLVGAVGATAAGVESNTSQAADPYVAWVNLIRAEERCAVYTDAGGVPPLLERSLLKGCRAAYRWS